MARTRDPAKRALRELKIFAPKTIPTKKGKGTKYSRKGRKNQDDSRPFLLFPRRESNSRFYLTKVAFYH